MAHIEFLGDSYQYVHRVLLETIAPQSKWTVHPMLFRSRCECKVTPKPCPQKPGGGLDLGKYATFLGLQRKQVLPENPQKQESCPRWQDLVKDVRNYEYLFLDPDTGIDMEGTQGRQKHIRKTDLFKIVRQEGRQLVLVFEHSYRRKHFEPSPFPKDELRFLCSSCQPKGMARCSRCKTVVTVRRKLVSLCELDGANKEKEAIHCGAVIVRSGSLVSYIWLSTNEDTVERVRSVLLDKLSVPDWRLLACQCGQCPD